MPCGGRSEIPFVFSCDSARARSEIPHSRLYRSRWTVYAVQAALSLRGSTRIVWPHTFERTLFFPFRGSKIRAHQRAAKNTKGVSDFFAQLRGLSRRSTLLPRIAVRANVKNLNDFDFSRSIVASISTSYVKTTRRPESKFQNGDSPQHEFVEHWNGEGGVAVARTPDHSFVD